LGGEKWEPEFFKISRRNQPKTPLHVFNKTSFNINFLDNFQEISVYGNRIPTAGVYCDILDGLCYQSKLDDTNYVTMVWHIDGAPTIKSKTLDIWLITAFIVELPIKRRFALRDIILCGVWYGNTKPDFELFQLHFVKEVKRLRDHAFIVHINGQELEFTLKLEASLADLPARAASLNMKQFNGRFGCTLCYHPGCKLNEESLVRIYPYQNKNDRVSKRTHEETCRYADAADKIGDAVFGLKGRSNILDIILVPSEVPFDYMLLVLEGELK